MIVQVFEAPNYEALQAYSMEPVVMNMLSFDMMEVKAAVTVEETLEIAQRAFFSGLRRSTRFDL